MFPPHRSPRPAARSVRALASATFAALALTLALAAPAGAATVSTGSGHICAVEVGGTVSCWGDNSKGQIGDGTTTDRPTPTRVAGISTATEVAVGPSYSCALLASGTVKCWGWNLGGTLGDGTRNDSLTPVQVTGVTNAVAIVADHPTCALTAANEVFCWGWWLHDPAESAPVQPVSAATPIKIPELAGATDVSVRGNGEVCGIRPATTTCVTDFPANRGGYSYSDHRVVVTPSADIQQTTGVCALLASGQVSCHGGNIEGVLGNQSPSDAFAARGETAVQDLSDARSISADSGSHRYCALRENSDVVCWGAEWGAPPAAALPQTVATGIRAIVPGCLVSTTGALSCLKGYPSVLTEVPGITVATSDRDAVTPVRRGEPDTLFPLAKPSTPAKPDDYPVTTTPPTTEDQPTTPTTPEVVAERSEVARSAPPATIPVPAPIVLPMPKPLPLALGPKSVVFTGFVVKNAKGGSCPASASVTVRSGSTTQRRTFKVRKSLAGSCTIDGVLKLTGKLAKAQSVKVQVTPKRGKTVSKKLKVA